MANEEHLAVLEQGVDGWNQWRDQNPETKPDLSDADLTGAKLRGANLRESKLFRTSLSKADLLWASLREADLSGANLSGASLGEANLSEAHLIMANLSEADLSGANLIAADLMGANLMQANLSGANLNGADLSDANLSEVDLTNANLFNSSLVGANLNRADLTGCRIYGISAWDLKGTPIAQSGLIITPEDQPTITVEDLQVAQFVYLLLRNGRIRDIINTITTKVVLILGRFSPERKSVLDAIREELCKCNYVPVLFDFDKPSTRDTQETITTLARLARFVVADITDPKSIPQELISIVETLPSVPVQPVLQSRSEPWGMFDHIKRYPWVLKVCRYDDEADLLAMLQRKVIAPAEAKAKELEKK